MLVALHVMKKREEVVVSGACLLEASRRADGQENDSLVVQSPE